MIFVVATLFFLRFAFYPISSSVLNVFGIRYDFSRVSLDRYGVFSISDFELDVENLFSFSANTVEISLTRRFTGLIRKRAVVRHLKVENGYLYLDSQLFDSDDDFSFPEELPYFPLENIDIRNLNISAVQEDQGVVASEITVSGNGTYYISVPEIILMHPGIEKDVKIKLEAGVTAQQKRYLIEHLDVYSQAFHISGKKDGDETLKAEMEASFSEIASFFGYSAEGELYADFRLSFAGAVPEIDGNLTINNIEYEGFKPWDIHAFFKLTPSALILNRLNLFHNNKVFLSLDSIFPFKSKKASGTVRFFRFDLDDTLNRMTTSGIVNLIVSGKADYLFSLETLSADFAVDLIVNELDVDEKEVLSLPREVFVNGNCTVSPDGVKLHNAVVKTKNENSRVMVKDSWFGYGDNLKYHIPILAGSWVNLEDVGMISGFPVKGSGSVEGVIGSFYENTEISGSFSGSGCHFDGFSAEICELDISLKDSLLSLKIKNIEQDSLSVRDAVVGLDFNRIPVAVDFAARGIKGSIKDAAKVFDVDAEDVEGTILLSFDGLFEDELKKLNGHLKSMNIGYKGEKVADLFQLNLKSKDDEILYLDDSFIKYGETEIDITGTIDKSDLSIDIKAVLSSFSREDFGMEEELFFKNPDFAVNITGTLDTPDIKAAALLEDIVLNSVKLGDFSFLGSFEGETRFMKAGGHLGKNVQFGATMSELDKETFSGYLKAEDFTHKEAGFFFRVSLDANVEENNVNALITKLMFEKSGFFIRNSTPFYIRGTTDDLEIEKVYFDGETVNFHVEGSIKDFQPEIKAKGIMFPRMVDMIYPAGFSGIDGRAYFDVAYYQEKFSGRVRISEMSYRLNNPQIVFKDINSLIILEDRNWHIENFKGYAGSGQIVMSGAGTLFPFDDASLNIRITNLTGRHHLAGDFGMSASLNALLVEQDRFSLSGDVEVRNVEFNQPLSIDSELFKLIQTLSRKRALKGEESLTPVDLGIKFTGRNNLRVRTNLITSDVIFDTFISGTTNNPDVTGTLVLRNGSIEYKQNDFTIQRGIITFEDGGGINPYVDIESFTNITARTGDDERDFRLIMYANGYVLEDDLRITLDSIPQLDQQQLYSLLLWGNIGDTYSGDLAIAAITDIMGITAEVRRSFGLSRFELTPRYSDIDGRTILKLVAEKEIYDNLFLALESNPADPSDQKVELKYRTRRLEAGLEWRNKDKLENIFGAIGFNLRLEYVFE